MVCKSRLKQKRALNEERIKLLITKEPDLVNGTIAARFGVSNGVVGRIRRMMNLESPASEYLTEEDMKKAKCCYGNKNSEQHTPVCARRKPKKEKYVI